MKKLERFILQKKVEKKWLASIKDRNGKSYQKENYLERR